MVVGLLGNKSSDSNRLTLVTPKSENDVRLQATLGNQNPIGLPVGVVRHLDDGRYALVEVKLGGDELIRAGIDSLKSLQNKIRADKQNPPAFAMILTAAGDAYTTAEGIHVVPINKLRA